MQESLISFKDSLASKGVDIVQEFNTEWYNTYVASESLPLSPLPTYGRASAKAVVIGNSRALWPAFLNWLSRQSQPEEVQDPLDKFIQSTVEQAIAELCSSSGVAHDIFWPWESGERLVSMQRVAIVCGMCYHDTETQLAIHPKFGAWVAFRAVVVFDAPGDAVPTPERLGCLMSEEEKVAAREAMAAALRASDEANLCTQLHGEKGMERDVRLAWAALRDCVAVGREARYSEAQLTYHYTKDKKVLLQAMHDHLTRP